MRWPLYFAEAVICAVAIVVTVGAYVRRGSGWRENLIILPWLFGSLGFAVYLCVQVVQAGWQDIPPLATNAFWSGVWAVAGPFSVVVIMGVRLWQSRGKSR